MSEIPIGWVIDILGREKFDSRFELFANDAVACLEGTPVARTSSTRDLGRDGRSTNAQRGLVVATTLREDVKKALDDVRRLLETTRPLRHIYIVSAKELTDERQETMRSEAVVILEQILGQSPEVSVLSAIQLGGFVEDGKIAADFVRRYAADLDIVRARLASPSVESVEARAFDLALGTIGDDDAPGLRRNLLEHIILTLVATTPGTPAELSAAAREAYGLPGLADVTVREACERLRDAKEIDEHGPRYGLTGVGKARLDKMRQARVGTELVGAQDVRTSIEKSLGSPLTDSQWVKVWRELQTETAHLFYRRGLELIEMVGAFVGGDTRTQSRQALREVLTDAFERVGQRSAEAPQRKVLAEALNQAFMPGDPGGAFEWFAQVAAAFVALCTLGLTPEVFTALETTLASIRFVFDTDVVISFLCSHEPGHGAAKALFDLGRRLQRPPMITAAVAEEAARHAMKAHVDYDVQVAGKPALAWNELQDLESAFTREFEHCRLEGQVAAAAWRRYIEAFTGPFARGQDGRLVPNTTKMRQILTRDGYMVLPPGANDERWRQQVDSISQIVMRVRSEMERRRAAASGQEAEAFEDEREDVKKDKARLDGELLVGVARAMEDAEAAGRGERFVLVTSSSTLRRVPGVARNELGSVPEVLTPIEASLLAALLPAAPVGLGVLRGLLFEGEFRRRLEPVMRQFIQVLGRIKSAKIPGASRGVLREAFSDVLLREARTNRERVRDVRRRAKADPVLFARLAASAVDALGLQDPVEREDVLQEVRAVAALINNAGEKKQP